MATEICLFVDERRHACGEPSVGLVAIAPPGMSSHEVPTCRRHTTQLTDTYVAATANTRLEPASEPVQTAAVEPTEAPAAEPQNVQVSASDTAGTAERT